MPRLNEIEKRYCRCIVHVSKSYPRSNPYAVCSSSVYTKARGIHRDKVVHCAPNLTYENFPTDELRGYARLKNIASGGSRSQLIKSLYAHATKKIKKTRRGGKLWSTYLKEYKKDHPYQTHVVALKRAASEYRKMKGAF